MLRRRRQRENVFPWIQLILDAAVIYAILFTAFWFRFKSPYFESVVDGGDYENYYNSFHFSVLTIIFFLRSKGLYQTTGGNITFYQESVRVIKSVLSSTLVLLAVSFFIRDFSFSRSFMLIASAFLMVGIILVRWIFGSIVVGVDKNRGSLRNVLIIGQDAHAEKLNAYYKKYPRAGRRVYGCLSDSSLPVAGGVRVLGRLADLPRLLREDRMIHEVVLAQGGMSNEEVLKIIYECEKEMVAFRWIADIFGLIAARMSVSYVGGVSLLSFTDSPLAEWENRVLKRLSDILLSLIALLILSIPMAILAALIKLDSKGPVFYRQERIGEDGEHFMLLKFRTMRTDAEKETGPVWARENDPRRTRLGTFLRENNLDELPQFWNVFVGEMSLVGPRPERPFFVSQFKEDIPRYMARHAIKSGITGWAQVNGLRGNTSIEERTKFDLYYIENWSLVFDIKILFMTLLARHNAY